MHLWLPRKYFIIETMIIWHYENEKMVKNKVFLFEFSYINKDLYLDKNFNHLKLRYADPCNFFAKRALVSQPNMLAVA